MSVNICDSANKLCNSIQTALNMVLNDYQIKINTPDKGSKLLTHSGSAPMGGWVNINTGECGGNSYLSKAIHKYPLSNYDSSGDHYKYIYVWHTWLKLNSPYFIYNYSNSDQTGLPLLNILTPRSFEYNPIKPSEFLLPENTISDKDRFDEVYTEFNDNYPIVGKIHRCLIIIRYINEQFDNKNSKLYIPDEILIQFNIETQQIYYPLFYLINIIIHISMIYYSIGNVDYETICYYDKPDTYSNSLINMTPNIYRNPKKLNRYKMGIKIFIK